MAKTKITMLRDQLGAANPEGSSTRMYQAGESYEVETDLADAFVKMGAATETNPDAFPCANEFDPRGDGQSHQHRTKAAAYDCMRPLIDETIAHVKTGQAYDAARADNDREAATDDAQDAAPTGPKETKPVGPSETPALAPGETKDLGDPLLNMAAGLPVDGQGTNALPLDGQQPAPTDPPASSEGGEQTKPLTGDPGAKDSAPVVVQPVGAPVVVTPPVTPPPTDKPKTNGPGRAPRGQG